MVSLTFVFKETALCPSILRLPALPAVVWIITTISPLSLAEGATRIPKSQITILYDAFGRDPSMKKDWGFSALVEIGKRILFDTGDDREIFAANARAKGVDIKTLDFVVVSHRHSDHIAGLSHVLAVNPEVTVTFSGARGSGSLSLSKR